MMARFSAIVRVGSMRWPSGVVTGPAVALTDWGLVTLAVRRRMFHQSLLHAAATTAILSASNACPLKARRVPGSRQVSAASVQRGLPIGTLSASSSEWLHDWRDTGSDGLSPVPPVAARLIHSSLKEEHVLDDAPVVPA
jgi:hypothetical protein